MDESFFEHCYSGNPSYMALVDREKLPEGHLKVDKLKLNNPVKVSKISSGILHTLANAKF